MEERLQVGKTHHHDGLMKLALSFLASRALHTAVQLDVFTHLSDRALTLPELSAVVGVPPTRLEKLLNTCIGLELLERRDSRFANTPMAEACLIKGRADYFGDMIRYVHFLFYDKGEKMEEAVRTDQPLMLYEPIRRSDDEVSRLSTLAMEGMSGKVGRLLAAALDLSNARRLLDVGGGSGVIARSLAEAISHLEVVILDQPRVLKVAQELSAASPAASRIRTHAADYNQDPFPGGFEVLILSNIIHINGADACRRLMHKAHGALSPGGQAVVIDFYLEDDKRGPLFGNLFGLACAMLSPGGATYSWAETEGWLREAGFQDVQRLHLTEVTGCIVGRRG